MRWLHLALLLLLGACQTTPIVPSLPWPQQRGQLQSLGEYRFTGRIAVAHAGEGFSAGVRWQQRGSASELSLSAPLGIGALQMQYVDGDLMVRGSDGTQYSGADATSLVQQSLGFAPPMRSLRYWLLGASDPASPADEVVGEDQRLRSLKQGEWQVVYDDYRRTGRLWLPSRVVLTREDVRVRLAIGRWQL